jgi:hypothetical protein
LLYRKALLVGQFVVRRRGTIQFSRNFYEICTLAMMQLAQGLASLVANVNAVEGEEGNVKYGFCHLIIHDVRIAHTVYPCVTSVLQPLL